LRLTPIALLALALATRAEAQDRTVWLAGRQVAVWEGRGNGSMTAPVLFFSHGFGGCETGSNFLKTALAARGYWVFAPRHADARCGSRQAAPPAVPFGLPAEGSDATYVNRANDILAVHGALQADPAYNRRLDFSRVGYAGHSLGGYTAVGLAGGWKAWGKAPGVRAVLALSPYIEPFLQHATMSGLSMPIMVQGGTADEGMTPYTTRRGGGYDSAPAPKYLVVFKGAKHAAWGDRPDQSHDNIVAYAVAFLDQYVRGLPPSAALTTVKPGVAALKFDAGQKTTEVRGTWYEAPRPVYRPR
jgi:predicted dienelactone hydrolase